jgi:hypothetical protein
VVKSLFILRAQSENRPGFLNTNFSLYGPLFKRLLRAIPLPHSTSSAIFLT